MNETPFEELMRTATIAIETAHECRQSLEKTLERAREAMDTSSILRAQIKDAREHRKENRQ